MKLPFKRGEDSATAVPEPRTAMFPAQDDLHRMFDRFFNGDSWPFGVTWPGSAERLRATFAPTVDVADGEDHVEITAELPGLDAQDIQLELENGALVLSGEKKLENEAKEKGVWRTERSWGSFQRVIPLPVEVDQSAADASFDKGVLTVRLPKTTHTPKRKIDIRP